MWSVYAAYELYQDGRKLGGNGNLDSGNFSLHSIRSYYNGAGPIVQNGHAG